MTLRPLVFGNFNLMGVIMSYAEDPTPIKRATGWNFVPLETARAMHEHLIERGHAGRFRTPYNRATSTPASELDAFVARVRGLFDSTEREPRRNGPSL